MSPLQSPRPFSGAAVTSEPAAVERRRTITPSQLADAITQLRERRGQSAALQMQAVLRALDLVVLPASARPTARSERQAISGPCAACVAWVGGADRPGHHTCW